MKNNTNTDYFQNTHKVAQSDIQDSYYKISTTLNNLKKEILQQIVLGININNNFYINVHNITDKLQQRKFKHKIHKICIVKFDNKASDYSTSENP